MDWPGQLVNHWPAPPSTPGALHAMVASKSCPGPGATGARYKSPSRIFIRHMYSTPWSKIATPSGYLSRVSVNRWEGDDCWNKPGFPFSLSKGRVVGGGKGVVDDRNSTVPRCSVSPIKNRIQKQPCWTNTAAPFRVSLHY